MRIINFTQNTVVAVNCRTADNFFSRFKGLMGEKHLAEGDGLLITPCSSIHMFFMKFPLDIVFIDKDGIVIHLIEKIRPWMVSPVVREAHSVIELPVGTIKASCTKVGDKLIMARH